MAITDEIRSSVRMANKFINEKDRIVKKSIARGASDSIMQFSALISDTIPVNMAHVITQKLDRVYAVFSQTYFSLNSTINISTDASASTYIRRFHQNLTESTELNILNDDKFDVDLITEGIDEGLCSYYHNYNNTYGILYSFIEPNASLVHENKAMMIESDEVLYEDNNAPATNDVIRGYLYKKKNADYASMQKDVRNPELLDRNDIKKSNDMQPLTMSVRLMGVNDKDEFVQYVDFICGVKTVLHLVKSDDMCEEIDKSIRNNSRTFNFIRWTTGEISFLKDFLLGINNIRDDIAARNESRVPFFATLRRLKRKRFDPNIRGINKIIPNATLIISAYEVEELENKYGYNIRDIKMAKRLMDALLLLAFIIVDEGTETINILYDGRNSFETYSLDSLERETIQQSSQLSKELTRMIGSNT